MKLIINNHKNISDKLTKISGRDLTTKFTKDIKSWIVNCHMYKDFDNCSILKKYTSPAYKSAGSIKRTVITISDLL